MHPLPERGLAGAPDYGPQTTGRSGTAARAGTESCRSDSRDPPPATPSSLLPSLPPRRPELQHPCIPASEQVLRFHRAPTGPS